MAASLSRNDLSCLFSPKLEPANPAQQIDPSYFAVPYGISCDISGLCPQRLMYRVPARTGILSSLAAAEGWREGLICTVMEMTMPPDLTRVAQPRFFGNSSNWYIVNIHKKETPITLVDSCCLTVSTIAS
jgi:hypothetical protein